MNPARARATWRMIAASAVFTASLVSSTPARAQAPQAVRVVTSELGERAEVTGAAAMQLSRAPVALAERLAGRG